MEGVTRDSIITLLKEMGLKLEERPISIDEIIDAHKGGTLKEVFGTGTAATVTLIKELRYKDYVMEFDTSKWKTVPEVKRRLDSIREGKLQDTHGWMFKI